MITADFHSHTHFSTDSNTPMESMIKEAISLGLTTLCFTDHMDYDYPDKIEGSFLFEVTDYLEQIAVFQKKYENQVTLRRGIELGMQPHLSSRYDALINAYPFDFVICSTHLVHGFDPFYPEFWKDTSEESVKHTILEYFESILNTIHIFQNFDVYGHLDYIIRYIPKFSFSYEYSSFSDILDSILTSLIQYGKGIEVNTAGYKYGLNHTNPSEDIIKRYLELGGDIITVGSDGHKPEHLAYDFSKARDMLLSLGVKYYTVFENRKPVFRKL